VHTGRTIVLACITAVLMKFFIVDCMIAEGRSMVPTIYPGTILVVNRLAYGFRLPWQETYLFRWGLPKTGDVVVFSTPQGTTAVKRCGEITEARQFFALGDNSAESYDSRSYGPLPADRIIGKVLRFK
jgi:signal peptidase I